MIIILVTTAASLCNILTCSWYYSK